MKRIFLLICISFTIYACQQNENVDIDAEIRYALTSLDQEPTLREYINSMTSISGRTTQQVMDDLNGEHVIKLEKPEFNEEIFSVGTFSNPLKTVVLGVKDTEYYGYTITHLPALEWDGIFEKFTGQVLFHTLDGQLWLTATLKDGENVAREQVIGGRIEGCWNSIDVYYTFADVDNDGDLDLTHIEFGDSYIECDPMDPSGVPPTPDDDNEEQPGGASGGKGPGVVGFCPVGYEDVGNGCVPKCQQGEERNDQGDCVARTTPCAGDPLVNMKISTYNNGVSSNRYGCVRVDPVKSCGGKSGKRKHGGIDLMGPEGTAIFSITEGTVYLVQTGHVTFGNWIIIENNDIYYAYAHLENTPSLNVGNTVSAGTQIGNIGDTGNAPTGEFHLHLTVKEKTSSEQTYNQASAKNPEDYLGTKFDSNGSAIENNDC